MKHRRFFFHYNKPHNKITVHWQGRCIIADNIECLVPTESKWNKSQPRLVIRGFAKDVTIKNGVVTIA